MYSKSNHNDKQHLLALQRVMTFSKMTLLKKIAVFIFMEYFETVTHNYTQYILII